MTYPGDMPGPGEIHPWDDPFQAPNTFDRPLAPPVPGVNPWEYQEFHRYQEDLVIHDIAQWQLHHGGSQLPTEGTIISTVPPHAVLLLLLLS